MLGLTALQRNNSKRLGTTIAGGGHGTNCVGGDEVVLAESGELLLHGSNQFVDGVLLLPSAQRHALHTHRKAVFKLALISLSNTLVIGQQCTGI